MAPALIPARKPHDGFSLIEVMIMLTLLVVGVLAVARLFPIAGTATVRDRKRTAAAYYVQQRVESLRTLQMNDIDLSAGRHPSNGGNEPVGSGLQRYWTVSQLDPPLQNVSRVAVVVRWVGPTGTDSVMNVTYVNH